MRKNFCIVYFVLFLSLMYCFRCAAQDTKENAEFKMAMDLYKDNLFDLAKDQFKSFIQKFPSTQQAIDARFYLGLCYLKTKSFEEAKNTFQNFAITYSDNTKAVDAWWNVGEAYVAMKNYSEAASAFERLKTFHPKSSRASEALLEASKYYQIAGNPGNAGIALRAILQEYPNSSEVLPARFAIGKLYTSTGDFDRAFSELNRVAEGTTNQELKAKAITAIGLLHSLIGNNEDAEKKFREVITLFPKTNAVYESYVRLGDLQRQFQNFSEASQNYNTVANSAQADAAIRQEAFMGAAECAIAAGDFKGAIKIYENFITAFQAQEISARIYLAAAKTARKAGEYLLASQYYDYLLKDTLSKNDKRSILKDAAENEIAARDFNGAIQHYQSYILKYPNDAGTPFALFQIGTIIENEFKNYSRAISMYNTILDKYGTSEIADDALYARGRCAHTAKKYDDAIESYQQISTQYPASEFLKDAEKVVDDIQMTEETNPRESIARLAQALSSINSNNPTEISLLLGEIYLKDIKDFSAAAKYYDDAVMKGAKGNELEQAVYGRALCEAMLVKKGKSTSIEAERLLNEFLKNYPASSFRDEAAYQRYRLKTDGQSGTPVALAASDYLNLNPKIHLDEVTLEMANAKRESGRSSEAEADYTKLMNPNPHNDVSFEALFGRGIARMNLSNYSGATSDLKSYITQNGGGKNAANALMNLAQIAEKQGQYEQAATYYEEASNRFSYSPSFKSADLKMIKALADGGYHDRAVVKAAMLLQKEKDNPFASEESVGDYMFTYAEILAKKKDIMKAKKILQEYQVSYPHGKHIGEVYYALGRIFKDEGKITLATVYFKQSGMSSGNLDASRDAADLLLESKKFDEAIQEYKRLSEKTTNKQEKAYYDSRIIVAYYRANNPVVAQTNANEFQTKYPDAQPNFDEFEFERGKYLHHQKQYEKALDAFDDLTGSKTTEIASLASLWVGKTYESINQNQKAIDQFNKVITTYPGTSASLEASLSLGRIAFRAEKWDEAAKNFKMVVDQTNVPPEFMKEALNELIHCLDQLNIADGAAEMTKRFISLYPNDPTIFRKKVNLGMFYQKLGYFDQAITHYENLLGEAASDDQAEIRYYIGESYFGKADYTQAILEFLKVKYLVTKKTEMDWISSSYHYAGQAYEKLGQYDKAINMYQLIIDSPGVDETFKAAAEKEIKRVKALMK